MRGKPLISTRDLLPSELRLLRAAAELGYGRFEGMTVRQGELVLSPWPRMIRDIKFGSRQPNGAAFDRQYDLKKQASEFFEFVRSLDAGVILFLEVKDGLPFRMEIEDSHERAAHING